MVLLALLLRYPERRWALAVSAIFFYAGSTLAVIAFNHNVLDYFHGTVHAALDTSCGVGGVLRSIFGLPHAWLQFLPTAIGAAWFARSWIRTRRRSTWEEHLPLLLLVSLGAGPYSWAHDYILALPSFVALTVAITHPRRLAGRFGPFFGAVLYLQRGWIALQWHGWQPPACSGWSSLDRHRSLGEQIAGARCAGLDSRHAPPHFVSSRPRRARRLHRFPAPRAGLGQSGAGEVAAPPRVRRHPPRRPHRAGLRRLSRGQPEGPRRPHGPRDLRPQRLGQGDGRRARRAGLHRRRARPALRLRPQRRRNQTPTPARTPSPRPSPRSIPPSSPPTSTPPPTTASACPRPMAVSSSRASAGAVASPSTSPPTAAISPPPSSSTARRPPTTRSRTSPRPSTASTPAMTRASPPPFPPPLPP